MAEERREPRSDAGRVTVVIVSWNSADFLEECLRSVAAQTLPPVEVVVVDNASTDGSADLARRHGATVHTSVENLGFCRASNLGWAAADGGAALFLNPDVVLEPDYLEQAVPVLQEERVGFVAGKLLRFDRRTIDSAGQRIARSRRTIDRGYGEVDDGRYDEPASIDAVCGAAALYRREALEQVAPDGEVFDEDFFAYHEDLDLGWRATRAGWEGRYVPGARGYHFRGSTDPAARGGRRRRRLAVMPDGLAYHVVKNRYLSIIKNDSAAAFLRDLPFILGRDLLLWSYLVLRRPRVGWRVLADRDSRRRAWDRRRRAATAGADDRAARRRPA